MVAVLDLVLDFSLSNELGKNDIIFSVNNSLSVHTDNKKKISFFLVKGLQVEYKLGVLKQFDPKNQHIKKLMKLTHPYNFSAINKQMKTHTFCQLYTFHFLDSNCLDTYNQ